MVRDERIREELLSGGRRLDPESPVFDEAAAEDLSSEARRWAVGKLARILELVDEGLLDELEIAADELAACTNEQKLARRLRIHAENLREAAGLPEPEGTEGIGV